jgi:hypothetical protein
MGPYYPPRYDCEVSDYLAGEQPPAHYVVVGAVEARGAMTMADVIPALEQQACSLGANTLINISFSGNNMASATAALVQNGS